MSLAYFELKQLQVLLASKSGIFTELTKSNLSVLWKRRQGWANVHPFRWLRFWQWRY